MITCPSCSAELTATSRFCSSCGVALDADEFRETRVAIPRAGSDRPGWPPSPPSPGWIASPANASRSFRATHAASRISSSDSIHEGRFIPGTMLAGRYRIAGLLGRGGMGEVCRADDLKLGQPVALKFLPESLAADPGRLDRFINEVRIARQVSHPNVCRVYDIGEFEGGHFLSMEYVDGEDLASLLRRIGRLPGDKAVEIARQLCAGLAAAHEKGVLHRDLKPANVMIDGRGKVRITDFGLAAIADEIGRTEVRVGTPAYMAPEQIAGKEVTIRSDIYSLGLILYETLTGKTPFVADTLADLVRMHTETMPTTPSSLVMDLDPALERVILRCLEKDPNDRPSSALAVAAALPGGDPLAAALAAGETPSPEMVAAAGDVGALRPLTGIACIAAFVIGLVALGLVAGKATLTGLVKPPKPPAVLEERAREVIRSIGYTDPPADTAWRFGSDPDILQWVKNSDPSPQHWDALKNEQPPALLFWYRESPRVLVPVNPTGTVLYDDPPWTISGMKNVILDARGRLVQFIGVPPQVEEMKEPSPAPDWGVLFKEAGLDFSKFIPAEPKWTPLHYSNARAAWEGEYPERPGTKIRVEAASYRGRPIYFEIVGPWSRPDRMQPFQQSAGLRIGMILNVLLIMVVLAGAIFLARQNLRAGRCDRRGAFRVALFALAVNLGAMLINASHGSEIAQEWSVFIVSTGISLFISGIMWLLYLALEPIVRKRWPDSIISWNRLLAGRFSDPLVGRDILIGAVFGVLTAFILRLHVLSPAWAGKGPQIPFLESLQSLTGARGVVVSLVSTAVSAIVSSMFLLFFITLGRIMARDRYSPVIVFFLIVAVMNFLVRAGGNLVLDILFSAIFAALLTAAYMRFGLLAGMSMQFFQAYSVPVTLDPSAWYSSASFLGMAVLLAIAGYAFYTSLGGQRGLSALTIRE